MPPLNSFSRTGLALAIGHALFNPVHAATIVVNGAGDVSAIDQMCTLREAIDSANNDAAAGNGCTSGTPGNDIVSFAPSVLTAGTITLTQFPNIDISEPVSIVGPSTGTLEIHGEGTERVFLVRNSTVSMSNLSIVGGNGEFGGGIYAYDSTLTLTDSTLSRNYASHSGGGVRIAQSGTLHLVNTTVHNNSANYRGAGVDVNASSATITGGSISSNLVYTGGGAGIGAFGSAVELAGVTVSSNTASAYGGGIYGHSSTLNVSTSTVSNNSAQTYGGGMYLFEQSTSMVDRSTVSGNSTGLSGGGMSINRSVIHLTNSTVSGNSAQEYGGGIYGWSHATLSLTLSNSTVSANAAGDGGGGVYMGSASSLTLSNNVIAGNTALNNYRELNFTTNLVSIQTNVFGDSRFTNSDAFNGFVPGPTNITATSDGTNPTALDQILKPLGANGGPNQTHLLVTGSPAVDAGDNAICASAAIGNIDQRGIPRPQGLQCDIGAVELEDEGFLMVPLANKKAVVISL